MIALAAGRVDHVVEIAEEHVRAAHGESAQGSDHRQPEARPWRDTPSKARVARQRSETRVLQHGGALDHVEQPRRLEREIDMREELALQAKRHLHRVTSDARFGSKGLERQRWKERVRGPEVEGFQRANEQKERAAILPSA